MKLQRLIQELYYEPALMYPEAHASIRRLLESRLGLEAPINAKQREANICGERVELPSMFIDAAGIAHIPIGGAIGQKLGDFAKWAGAVDVADIQTDLEEADANPKVRGIILDIDSPGGMVSGTPELAGVIEAVKKPVYAFSDGLMASAAYWLAAATDGIFTTLTANSGSIGVLLVVYDESQAFAQAGVKVEVIKAGKLKDMGIPGTSLSEDAKSHLQARVGKIYSMFTAHVVKQRGKVDESSMQGQTFMAEEAMKRGLIDAVVKNKAEVIRALF